jgi:hypothetical protein
LRLHGQSVGEREREAVVRGAAVGEHRLLRERREALGDLERALEVRAAGADLGDQPERERLGRVDEAAGEDEVERAAEADDPRQALRAAVMSGTPKRRSGKPSVDVSVAMRRSHHSASSSPRPGTSPRWPRSPAWPGCAA